MEFQINPSWSAAEMVSYTRRYCSDADFSQMTFQDAARIIYTISEVPQLVEFIQNHANIGDDWVRMVRGLAEKLTKNIFNIGEEGNYARGRKIA